MPHPYWPLSDLRLTTPDLELRGATEPDMERLSDVLPDDVEIDPRLPRFALGDNRTSRGANLHQVYWRALGNWSPESWTIPFVVWRAGDPIGLQALEGADFVALRTVDSFSLLVGEARGQGYGKQMREAVLALAFGPLGAVRAVSSAWHDNHASLGVSRALGYVDNGESVHRHDDRVDVMSHLRLTRDDWLARADRPPVEIGGFEACRPLFGL